MTDTPTRSRHGGRVLWMSFGLLGALISLMLGLLETFNISPRLLASSIEHRASGHHPLLIQTAHSIAQRLLYADRGELIPASDYPSWIGASNQNPYPSPLTSTPQTVVWVNSADQARVAIQHAKPGVVIQFRPGTYHFSGQSILATQAGRPTQPIIVRAEQLGTVILEFDLVEGFLVTAPFWIFENLLIRGACQNDSRCEHAFHIVGKASHFIARNNDIHDFNAHFKINGAGGHFPDHGRIQKNSLTNQHARRTGHSVTLVDLVAASHWRIQQNLIADFIKLAGDQTSYGGFAKGAGEDNQFTRNVILCTHLLRGQPGRQVGLSLGGGGSTTRFCRDQKCIYEQKYGVISNNLLLSCSDDGIYLNRATQSNVRHNTLIDTAGISIRFPETSAMLTGNLIDGPIRIRHGAHLSSADNISNWVAPLYLGHHSVRTRFINPTLLDLRWRDTAPKRENDAPEELDVCGAKRTKRTAYGAFEDFSICQSPP